MRNDLLLIIYKNMSLGDLLTTTNKKEMKSTLNCSKKKLCRARALGCGSVSGAPLPTPALHKMVIVPHVWNPCTLERRQKDWDSKTISRYLVTWKLAAVYFLVLLFSLCLAVQCLKQLNNCLKVINLCQQVWKRPHFERIKELDGLYHVV